MLYRACLFFVVSLFVCLPGCFVGPPNCEDAIIPIKSVTPATACLDLSAHFIAGVGPTAGPFLKGKNNCSETLTLSSGVGAMDAGVSDTGASQTYSPGATINFSLPKMGATIDGTLGTTRIRIETASEGLGC